MKIAYGVVLFFLAAGASLAGGIDPALDLNENVGLPAAIFHPAPVYTLVAIQLKLDGKVGIGAYVNEEGSVYDTIVSYGNPVLVQMATTAVKQWKFKPFLNEHGRPAKALVRLTFDLTPPAKGK